MMERKKTADSLDELVAKFVALDNGSTFEGDHFDDPYFNKLESVARLTLEAAIAELLDRIPERLFMVAYGDFDTEHSQEPTESARARNALLSFGDKVLTWSELLYAGGAKDTVKPVVSDLVEILYGGESAYFGQSPHRGLGNRKPRKVAELRQQALSAYKVGRKFGVSAGSLQSLISESYGASFDTVRKWTHYCTKFYDDTRLQQLTERRHAQFWNEAFQAGIAERLIAEFGRQYKEVWRQARK